MPSMAAWFEFKELRIAISIFFVMLVPVLSVMTLLQIFVPTAEVNRIIVIDYPAAAAPNAEMYVFYLTSAVAHVIVAGLVISMLRRRFRQNITEPKRRVLEIAMYSFMAVIVGLFVVCDSLNTILGRLSHERIYRVMEQSPLFSPYFRSFPGALVGRSSFPGFYLFSLLSGGLIIFGLIVIVLTCFNLGCDLVVLRNEIRINTEMTAIKRKDLDTKIRAFHDYFYILSAVLMTSTIATGFFFRLPLTTIAPGDVYGSFRDVSSAMTICWGVTFSLTMLAMCFYPYFRIQKDLRDLRRDSKMANDTEFLRWLDDNRTEYVVYTNMKTLLSIFLPAFVAVLSRFI